MANWEYPWSEHWNRRTALTVESSAADALPVLALVGLAFEARIAAGEGVIVVCRGSGCELSGALQRALRAGCRSIISFGVAGGLAPDLRAGDVVVASAVRDSQHTIRATDPIWSRKLLATVPDIHHGLIIGVNSAVLEPKAKRELYAVTGAVAVDMESHLVAQAAHAYNLAFAAVRVIVDSANRAVPEAALMAIDHAGNTEIGPVLRELLARPSALSALSRIACDAFMARSALLKVRRTAGRNFGFPELVDSTSLGRGLPLS